MIAPVPFNSGDHCPNCRSDDLNGLGTDTARCRGCKVALQYDFSRKAWARVASLYGMTKPKRVTRATTRRKATWRT